VSIETDELIEMLVADAAPVRPLAPPWLRTSIWFAISAGYVTVVVAVMSQDTSRFANIRFSRFWIEQAAAICTGVAAAAAAYLSVIPGRSDRWPLLPTVPLGVWLGILGYGCIRDWTQHGAAGLLAASDVPCAVAMLLGASVPVAVLMVALRSGAPLTPIATAALAGLAGGGLSSVIACVSRPLPHPTTMTVVVWHLGTLLATMAVVACIGRYVFTWPTRPPRSSQ
jgi:hypothetical protein